jgi:predicted GIY-YIG superfamily endonuclease
MTLNLENLTAQEAYEHMIWCEEAVKQLKEHSPRKARSWWEKDCFRPEWLQCIPAPGEKIHQFAERLAEEASQWAEAVVALSDAEEAAELEKRKEARRLLEREFDRKRSFLDLVRLCQSMPASDRILRGSLRSSSYVKLFSRENGRSELWISQDDHPTSGYVYLLSREDGRYKIGCTKRDIRKRTREILRKSRCSFTVSVKYPTVDCFKLETALHFHFRRCRLERKEGTNKGERMYQKGELFALSPEEASSFREIVAKVESLVLAAEATQVELEIMEIEAALKRAEATLR